LVNRRHPNIFARISVSTALGDYHIFGDGSPFSLGTVSGNDIFETGPGGFGVGTLTVSAVSATIIRMPTAIVAISRLLKSSMHSPTGDGK
jgi:hypothetical protein